MDKASARPFGFWTATALVVGGMIGSGIFLVPSALAPFGWTGTLAWVVASGGAIAIAWTLSRLAQTMPEATGAITVAAAVVGPLAGLLIGWSYWVAVWRQMPPSPSPRRATSQRCCRGSTRRR
jgi:APA family basic amino acid/polyamine antiporter